MTRIPVIDVTDLYHPYQDADDNLDLLLAFGLPEVELLGVVLDCHQPFRERIAAVENGDGLWADPNGPRDPGFVPVLQLNYIFDRPLDRTVPCAVAPFQRMRSPEDEARDAPKFQQAGIELLLRLLRESPEPVHLLGQGSARPIALAFNREPALMREKVARVHLCMGSSDPAFLEWNVALDVHAAVRVLTSDLPLALYPCATADGPFSMGSHNTYWWLETMRWVNDLHPRLRRYLEFVYDRSQRADFLRAMDEDALPGARAERYADGHHLWTTAAWMEITGRRLARSADGSFRLVTPDELGSRVNFSSLEVLRHALQPCELEVRSDGHFTFRVLEVGAPGGLGHRLIYERDDPRTQAAALNQAFPALYRSLSPDRADGSQCIERTANNTVQHEL